MVGCRFYNFNSLNIFVSYVNTVRAFIFPIRHIFSMGHSEYSFVNIMSITPVFFRYSCMSYSFLIISCERRIIFVTCTEILCCDLGVRHAFLFLLWRSVKQEVYLYFLAAVMYKWGCMRARAAYSFTRAKVSTVKSSCQIVQENEFVGMRRGWLISLQSIRVSFMRCEFIGEFKGSSVSIINDHHSVRLTNYCPL